MLALSGRQPTPVSSCAQPRLCLRRSTLNYSRRFPLHSVGPLRGQALAPWVSDLRPPLLRTRTTSTPTRRTARPHSPPHSRPFANSPARHYVRATSPTLFPTRHARWLATAASQPPPEKSKDNTHQASQVPSNNNKAPQGPDQATASTPPPEASPGSDIPQGRHVGPNKQDIARAFRAVRAWLAAHVPRLPIFDKLRLFAPPPPGEDDIFVGSIKTTWRGEKRRGVDYRRVYDWNGADYWRVDPRGERPDGLGSGLPFEVVRNMIIYYLLLFCLAWAVWKWWGWYARRRVAEFWASKENLWTPHRLTVGAIPNESIPLEMIPKGILSYLATPAVRAQVEAELHGPFTVDFQTAHYDWDPRNMTRLRIWVLLVPESGVLGPDEPAVAAARLELWIEPEVREWWWHTITKIRLIHAEGLAVDLPPPTERKRWYTGSAEGALGNRKDMMRWVDPIREIERAQLINEDIAWENSLYWSRDAVDAIADYNNNPNEVLYESDAVYEPDDELQSNDDIVPPDVVDDVPTHKDDEDAIDEDTAHGDWLEAVNFYPRKQLELSLRLPAWDYWGDTYAPRKPSELPEMRTEIIDLMLNAHESFQFDYQVAANPGEYGIDERKVDQSLVESAIEERGLALAITREWQRLKIKGARQWLDTLTQDDATVHVLLAMHDRHVRSVPAHMPRPSIETLEPVIYLDEIHRRVDTHRWEMNGPQVAPLYDLSGAPGTPIPDWAVGPALSPNEEEQKWMQWPLRGVYQWRYDGDPPLPAIGWQRPPQALELPPDLPDQQRHALQNSRHMQLTYNYVDGLEPSPEAAETPQPFRLPTLRRAPLLPQPPVFEPSERELIKDYPKEAYREPQEVGEALEALEALEGKKPDPQASPADSNSSSESAEPTAMRAPDSAQSPRRGSKRSPPSSGAPKKAQAPSTETEPRGSAQAESGEDSTLPEERVSVPVIASVVPLASAAAVAMAVYASLPSPPGPADSETLSPAEPTTREKTEELIQQYKRQRLERQREIAAREKEARETRVLVKRPRNAYLDMIVDFENTYLTKRSEIEIATALSGFDISEEDEWRVIRARKEVGDSLAEFYARKETWYSQPDALKQSFRDLPDPQPRPPPRPLSETLWTQFAPPPPPPILPDSEITGEMWLRAVYDLDNPRTQNTIEAQRDLYRRLEAIDPADAPFLEIVAGHDAAFHIIPRRRPAEGFELPPGADRATYDPLLLATLRDEAPQEDLPPELRRKAPFHFLFDEDE